MLKTGDARQRSCEETLMRWWGSVADPETERIRSPSGSIFSMGPGLLILQLLARLLVCLSVNGRWVSSNESVRKWTNISVSGENG